VNEVAEVNKSRFSAKLVENQMFCYRLVENTQLGGFVRCETAGVVALVVGVSEKSRASPRNQRRHKKLRLTQVTVHPDHRHDPSIDTVMENMSDLEADMDVDKFDTDVQQLGDAHESADVEVNTATAEPEIDIYKLGLDGREFARFVEKSDSAVAQSLRGFCGETLHRMTQTPQPLSQFSEWCVDIFARSAACRGNPLPEFQNRGFQYDALELQHTALTLTSDLQIDQLIELACNLLSSPPSGGRVHDVTALITKLKAELVKDRDRWSRKHIYTDGIDAIEDLIKKLRARGRALTGSSTMDDIATGRSWSLGSEYLASTYEVSMDEFKANMIQAHRLFETIRAGEDAYHNHDLRAMSEAFVATPEQISTHWRALLKEYFRYAFGSPLYDESHPFVAGRGFSDGFWNMLNCRFEDEDGTSALKAYGLFDKQELLDVKMSNSLTRDASHGLKLYANAVYLFRIDKIDGDDQLWKKAVNMLIRVMAEQPEGLTFPDTLDGFYDRLCGIVDFVLKLQDVDVPSLEFAETSSLVRLDQVCAQFVDRLLDHGGDMTPLIAMLDAHIETCDLLRERGRLQPWGRGALGFLAPNQARLVRSALAERSGFAVLKPHMDALASKMLDFIKHKFCRVEFCNDFQAKDLARCCCAIFSCPVHATYAAFLANNHSDLLARCELMVDWASYDPGQARGCLEPTRKDVTWWMDGAVAKNTDAREVRDGIHSKSKVVYERKPSKEYKGKSDERHKGGRHVEEMRKIIKAGRAIEKRPVERAKKIAQNTLVAEALALQAAFQRDEGASTTVEKRADGLFVTTVGKPGNEKKERACQVCAAQGVALRAVAKTGSGQILLCTLCGRKRDVMAIAAAAVAPAPTEEVETVEEEAVRSKADTLVMAAEKAKAAHSTGFERQRVQRGALLAHDVARLHCSVMWHELPATLVQRVLRGLEQVTGVMIPGRFLGVPKDALGKVIVAETADRVKRVTIPARYTADCQPITVLAVDDELYRKAFRFGEAPDLPATVFAMSVFANGPFDDRRFDVKIATPVDTNYTVTLVHGNTGTELLRPFDRLGDLIVRGGQHVDSISGVVEGEAIITFALSRHCTTRGAPLRFCIELSDGENDPNLVFTEPFALS
jgi:hypothetical protein